MIMTKMTTTPLMTIKIRTTEFRLLCFLFLFFFFSRLFIYFRYLDLFCSAEKGATASDTSC